MADEKLGATPDRRPVTLDRIKLASAQIAACRQKLIAWRAVVKDRWDLIGNQISHLGIKHQPFLVDVPGVGPAEMNADGSIRLHLDEGVALDVAEYVLSPRFVPEHLGVIHKAVMGRIEAEEKRIRETVERFESPPAFMELFQHDLAQHNLDRKIEGDVVVPPATTVIDARLIGQAVGTVVTGGIGAILAPGSARYVPNP